MEQPTEGEVRRCVVAAVALLASGDVEGSSRAVTSILFGGPRCTWAACMAWAEVVNQLALDPRNPQPAVLQLGLRDGSPVEPEDVPAQMHPQLWAARVVTAQANRDVETVRALLEAKVGRRADPAEVVDHVSVLLDLAASVVRAAPAGVRPGDVDNLMARWPFRPAGDGGGSDD